MKTFKAETTKSGEVHYEVESGGATRTYHYDCRGSTIAITDDSGNVTDRVEYSAYGITTYRAGNTDTPFLFNGYYGVMTDPNGLLYMRARYYNPWICRFINPDPSGFSGGLNWYAYANGNPVSLVDPFGLDAVVINGPISAFYNYIFGNGNPAIIGPDVLNSVQTLAGGTITQNAAGRIDSGDYWSASSLINHPYDVFNVGVTLGSFNYTYNGTTVTIKDTYNFPSKQNNNINPKASWEEKINNRRNFLFSWIPGTSYNENGSYQINKSGNPIK